MSNSEKIIRLQTVLARTGLSRSTIYREFAERTFPSQLKISIHGAGWHESAIDCWIADPAGCRADNDNRNADAGRGHARG
jgi:prophage regulatory protein